MLTDCNIQHSRTAAWVQGTEPMISSESSNEEDDVTSNTVIKKTTDESTTKVSPSTGSPPSPTIATTNPARAVPSDIDDSNVTQRQSIEENPKRQSGISDFSIEQMSISDHPSYTGGPISTQDLLDFTPSPGEAHAQDGKGANY